MANTKLAVILGLAVVGTVAAFLVMNSGSTQFRGSFLAGEDNLKSIYE